MPETSFKSGPDDTTIPPAVSEIDHDAFFELGERESRANLDAVRRGVFAIEEPAAGVDDELDLRQRLQSPEVLARRERFGRIVAICAAGAAALTLLGFAREVLTRGGSARSQVSAAPREESRRGDQTAPLVDAPVTAASSAAALSAAAVEPLPRAVVEPLPGLPDEARAAREDARRALEAGRVSVALVAAEKATALDRQDADAWLLLGATHLELGHAAKAREAFRTCVQHATKGARAECAAMLR